MPLKEIIQSTSESLSAARADTVASTTSYVSNGFLATFGALTFNQIMMLIGTVLAVATFGVNVYFQIRRDARERKIYERRVNKRDDTDDYCS